MATCAGLALLGPCPPSATAAPSGLVRAPSAGCQPEPAGSLATTADPPYPQRRYDFARLAALADGADITIAVIDSGVDDAHPQLRGRVSRGRDFLRGRADGRQDCVGHGTGVASIMVATPTPEVTGRLRGLAPAATVVPIRVSQQVDVDGRPSGQTVTGRRLADAIDWAVTGAKASIVTMSLVTPDDEAVRAAVRRAIAAGVVVVAAAGNQAEHGNPVPYPAAYPGVIGVGAIGADGLVQSYSQRGRYVDLVAPGAAVTVAAPGRGYRLADGTSYATPFVAATVALVRQRFPDLSPAQVERRLEATADPSPGGRDSEAYGRGILNPYRALTEDVSGSPALPGARLAPVAPDAALQAVHRRRAAAQAKALAVAAVSTVLIALVAVLATVLPPGRRRRWRPAPPG